MILKTIDYDPEKVLITKSEERKAFNKKIKDRNIIYFFYKNDKCYYIGETENTLWDRCFRHEKKHSERRFFKKCNKIHVIVLGSEIGTLERQTIEATFILAFKSAGHPLENKKG